MFVFLGYVWLRALVWLKLSLLDLSGSDPDTLGLCGLEFPVLGCSNRAWFLWTASECTFHALSCDCMPACQGHQGPLWASGTAGVSPCETAGYNIQFSEVWDGFHHVQLFTRVCVHSSVLMAGTAHRSVQHASCSAAVSPYQLLRSFWGMQCNPLNLFSCTQLLSKMMKYVFMQLISSLRPVLKLYKAAWSRITGLFPVQTLAARSWTCYSAFLTLLWKEQQQCLSLFCLMTVYARGHLQKEVERLKV